MAFWTILSKNNGYFDRLRSDIIRHGRYDKPIPSRKVLYASRNKSDLITPPTSRVMWKNRQKSRFFLGGMGGFSSNFYSERPRGHIFLPFPPLIGWTDAKWTQYNTPKTTTPTCIGNRVYFLLNLVFILFLAPKMGQIRGGWEDFRAIFTLRGP